MPTPDALTSSQTFKVYAPSVVLSGDVDLTSTSEIGGYSRRIYCNEAGNLVVTRLDGTDITVPFLAGTAHDLVVKGLKASGSTVKGILVMG